MHDDLLPYYNRELTRLRHLGREFAAQFPKVASRLMLEGESYEDPHVERLVQSFALLTARIHHKLDDELPEVTDALLGILYPHFLRPIPSMSLVQFQIDPKQTQLTGCYNLPRHTRLNSGEVNKMPCRFRTVYPVDMWPIRVARAWMEPLEKASFAARSTLGVAALHIQLEAVGGLTFSELKIDNLRFFLDGEGPLVHALYELLFNNTGSIALSAGDKRVALTPSSLAQVGFEPDEGMLDYDPRSSLGYRLLHEYFTYPEKFLFFEVRDLVAAAAAGFGREMTLTFYFTEFERKERLATLVERVNADVFKLGCTPIVNLFRQNAEPIQITHQRSEYQIIPDVRRPWGMEVYSIESVRKLVKQQDRADVIEYQPFFSLRHGVHADNQRTYWHAVRRPSPKKDDDGTDMYLSLVDLGFDPTRPDAESLSISVVCTNRGLPGQLPFGGEQGDFEVDGGSMVNRIRTLRKPTPTLRPALRRGAMWRLISHLSLNHLSIVENGREAFLEILSLYNQTDSPAIRKHIGGITALDSRSTVAKIGPPHKQSFVRGTEVAIEFDEDEFVGTGVYLMACVLERFLGLYAAINSFTQLTVSSRQRERPLRKWAARAGDTTLV